MVFFKMESNKQLVVLFCDTPYQRVDVFRFNRDSPKPAK